MFLNKVITNFRQYGFMGLAWRVVKKVFRLVGVSYDSYYYLACELDYKELAARWEANSLKDVRQLSLADYEHGDPAYFTEEKMEILSDRFQHDNYLAYGAFEGERLVYSAMISLEEMCFPTPEVSGTLDEHECLICDVYCDPDRRGKGYHNRMTVYLLMKGYEKGYRRAVTTVLKENKPSHKSFVKAGFSIKFSFYTLCIGGKSYTNYYKKKNKYASR